MKSLLACFVILFAARVEAAPEASVDVPAFVERWASVQNGGDFAAYQALYAPRMTGVRRSGPRTRRFGRAAWMVDRARMFKKPMKVDVSDLQVKLAKDVAVVELTQTFSQGTFKDAGKKRLVLVRGEHGWQITREEMLSSELLARPAASAPEDARFAWVLDGFVILSDSLSDDAFVGKPRSEDADFGEVALSKKIAPASLGELARWRGRKMKLFADGEVVCEAELEMPRGFGVVVPPNGPAQGEDDDGLWGLTGSLKVAARTKPVCGGAVFARAADLVDAPIAPALRDAGDELRAAALRAFRALREYKEGQASDLEAMQSGQVARRRPAPPWDEAEAGQHASVRETAVPGVGAHRHIVLVNASIGEDGTCSDQFGVELAAAFWVEQHGDKPQLVLIRVARDPLDIAAFGDFDGDGVPELHFKDEAPHPFWLGCQC